MSAAITLLVPNYNGGRFLETTLRSLLAQDHRDFVVEVWDNRSTDNSVSIVESLQDPRLRLVTNDEHVSHTRNFARAIASVSSPLFALCASDECYEPGWLSSLCALLDRHADAWVACCRPDSIDEEGRRYHAPQESYKDSLWPRGRDPVHLSPRETVALVQRGNAFIITTCVFRTGPYREVGGLSAELPFAGDWELWLRGALKGYSLVGTTQRLAHYRRHPGQLTRSFEHSLARFEDEARVVEIIASSAHAAGLLPSAEPRYRVLVLLALYDYASRVARGDREGARQVLSFLERRVPRAQRLWPTTVMQLLRLTGATGGRAATRIGVRLARALAVARGHDE